MPTSITVADKYTFHLRPDDHRVYIDRHDDPDWCVIESGSNAVRELMAEVERLRGQVSELEGEVGDLDEQILELMTEVDFLT